MAENELVTMGSTQAALFEDPTQLLVLSPKKLAELNAAVLADTKGWMPQFRRRMGLLAWVNWHQLPEGKYAGWLQDFAHACGVEPQTIVAWRRKVTSAERLAVPTAAAQRSLEQKTARQGRSAMKTVPSKEDPLRPVEAGPAGPGWTVAEWSDEPCLPTRGVPVPSSSAGTNGQGVDREGPVEGMAAMVRVDREEAAKLLAFMARFDPKRIGPALTPDEEAWMRVFIAAIVKSRTVTPNVTPRFKR